MSNYSPYNKTYRYLLFQNQAYHMKNKRNASPEIRTNLRHSMSRFSPVKDPQNHFQSYMYRSTRSQSTNRARNNLNIFLRDNQIKDVIVDKPIKLIHKNKSFQKVNKERIKSQNNDLVDRMIGSGCQVLKKSKALDQYQKHKKYSQIRAKYNELGQRKNSFDLGNKTLLCPTLSAFMDSGLGNSFIANFFANRPKRPQSRKELKPSSN